jgi:hypothetical protein
MTDILRVERRTITDQWRIDRPVTAFLIVISVGGWAAELGRHPDLIRSSASPKMFELQAKAYR